MDKWIGYSIGRVFWVVARGLLWCCSGLLLGYCKMVTMVFGVDAGILKKD